MSGFESNALASQRQDQIDAKLDGRIPPADLHEAYSMMHRADSRYDRALSAVALGDIPDAKLAEETSSWASKEYYKLQLPNP